MYALRILFWYLVGGVLVLGGCVYPPNSFRIEPYEQLRNRILFPPGAAISHDKLDLLVETPALRCQQILPVHTSGPVTVSYPYWPALGLRVLRVEIARNESSIQLTDLPPADCLNVTVRPALNQCSKDLIRDQVWRAIKKDPDWLGCLDPGFNSEKGEAWEKAVQIQLAADISQVLPHRASESGALRDERTYARTLEQSGQLFASPPTGKPLDTEFVSLRPGVNVCVDRDHTIGKNNSLLWVSSAQSCIHLLEASAERKSVVLSRTDTEYTFPFARNFYGIDEAKIYEARSWLAVRGMLATLMPQGAFLYLYYSNRHDPPREDHWESRENDSLRVYPGDGVVEGPLAISPILIAHSQPLDLKASGVPDLSTLCQANMVNESRVERRCFAFRDFASIDVLQPFSVNGRIQYAPSGTLTTDIPEIAASRRPVATRVFRGRTVPMDFDVANPQSAVPLAAGDLFGERQ